MYEVILVCCVIVSIGYNIINLKRIGKLKKKVSVANHETTLIIE